MKNKKLKLDSTKISVVVSVLILVAIGLIVWMYHSKGKTTAVINLFRSFDTPSFKFSIYGEGEGQLREPVAVDAASDGTVYVADAGAGDIKVFDSRGRYRFKFSKLEGEGRLSVPVGIAVKGDRVFVSDSTQNQIYIFNTSGKFVGNLIPPETKAKLYAFTPVGIEVTNSTVYFTDILFHRVIVTDLTGKLIKTIGGPGEKEGELAYPQDIAVTPDGKIFVSDSNNFRVQVAQDGSEFKLFKNKTGQPVIGSLVRGIAVDKDGYILVADALHHRVAVFDEKGENVYDMGEMGMADGQFYYPNGIAIEGNMIYIADRGNRRVQVFEQ